MEMINKLIIAIANKVPASIANKIAHDKLLHLIAGLIFAAPAAVAAFVLGGMAWWPVAAAGVVGLMKELLDAYKNHMAKKAGLPPPNTVDPLDLVWTAAAGVPFAVVLILLGLPLGIPLQ